MSPTNPDGMVTASQAARILGKDPAMITRYFAAGRLTRHPHPTDPRCVLVSRKELERVWQELGEIGPLPSVESTQPKRLSTAQQVVNAASTGPFAKRMRFIRIQRGMTQAALSHRTGLSRSYICDIERGRSAKYPNLETISQIADALGVPISTLIDTDELDQRQSACRREHLLRLSVIIEEMRTTVHNLLLII